MLDKNDLQQLRTLLREEVPFLIAPLLAPILGRLDKIEARLDVIEVRLDVIEVRLDAIEARLTDVEFRLTKLEERVWKLENEMRELREEVRRTRRMENEDITAAYVEIEKLDRRVSVVEIKVDKIME